jgi:hypothetical protein
MQHNRLLFWYTDMQLKMKLQKSFLWSLSIFRIKLDVKNHAVTKRLITDVPIFYTYWSITCTTFLFTNFMVPLDPQAQMNTSASINIAHSNWECMKIRQSHWALSRYGKTCIVWFFKKLSLQGHGHCTHGTDWIEHEQTKLLIELIGLSTVGRRANILVQINTNWQYR